MKPRFLLVSLLCSFALFSDLPAAKFDALVANGAEILRNEVVDQIQAKMDKGAKSAADFAPELKRLDEHAAKYADHPELAADFIMVKAGIYLQVLDDRAQGRKTLEAIVHDYPKTPAAEKAAHELASFDQATQRAAANADLQPLLAQAFSKANAGSHAETAFVDELAKLDALVKKYADNREAAANVMLGKAMIYQQAIGNPVKVREQLVAITNGYSGTLAAEVAKKLLAQIDGAAGR